MAVKHRIINAQVMHKRLRPRVHFFSYKIFYLCLALSEIDKIARPFFSVDRWNLFSFYRRDHGAQDGGDLTVWIQDILKKYDLVEADGEVMLFTLPRILGYVFNPVSFWFCLDRGGALRAVLSEVSNTFGERHCYLSFHADHRPITQYDRMTADKVFHVSPFMDVTGTYQFQFTFSEEKIEAWVNYFDGAGLKLTTSVGGTSSRLTTAVLLKNFFAYPLMTFKVIALIHWQAVRLIVKGIRYRPKPPPPPQKVTL